MCGICGIIGGVPRPEGETRQIIGSMMDSLAHRGPDGSGLAILPGFACGHRRLAIIDLDHGQQPMATADGRFHIVFNGEIYNYLELRQLLIQEGVHFRTFSDTEVLVALLARYGAEALDKLNGMYAFALHDTATGDWMLARDPFGIKPLYYAEVETGQVFASEIKALFHHPEIRARLDWESLQHYLTFQFCLHDRTLFAGIHTLEPGCYLAGGRSAAGKPTRYWDTDFTIDDYHTEEYFADRTRSLIQESVRLQIRSDVPVGSYLSGGLDSSIVTLFAAEALPGRMKSFHGLFAEGAAYDESSYARALAEGCGSELYTVTPTAQDFVDSLPRLIHAMDEPAAGPGLFPQYFVSRLAAEHVTVVLGGQGGDEVFGGYARYLVAYLEQALKGAILETHEEGRHVLTLESIIPHLPILRQYTPLLKQFWRNGLFEPMDSRYFHLLDRSPDLDRLLTPDAMKRIDRSAIFADFQKTFNHPSTKSYFNKMTHFDLKTLLPSLLQVEDRVSMAVGLESRVPLLDPHLVALACRMPPKLKFRGGATKAILKQAVRTVLPEAVLNRKDKMGFPVPLREWLSTEPVRGFVRDILQSKACQERGLFAPQAMEEMLNRPSAAGRQLWGALCLELWFRTFIDQDAARATLPRD